MAKEFDRIPPAEFLTPNFSVPLARFTDEQMKALDLEGIRESYVADSDNFGLLISRFVPLQVIRDSKEDCVFIKKGNKKSPHMKLRELWAKQCSLKTSEQNQKLKELIKAYYKRWKSTVSQNRYEAFKMTNATRLIIGLGGKGALEFGITLHHVTGLPFIPGSALKGLARSYALLTLAEAEGVAIDAESLKKFDEALSSPDAKHEQGSQRWHYQQAFGSQGSAGVCQFFDGVLAEIRSETLFTLDVMTPHFFSYYSSSGGSAPHDADNPNPVSYMTISAGNAFGFAIGLRHAADHEDNRDTLKQARRWLKDALQEIGVGSKTSSGYGYFVPEPK